MSHLVITRGIPGSGKTTWAREWVAEDPGKRVRVNRDELRLNLIGHPAPLAHREECAVTAAQDAAVRTLLDAGYDVVVDDTCIRMVRVTAWERIAAACGATFEVNEDFRDVGLDVCIMRDHARHTQTGTALVGKSTIEDMARRLKQSPRWSVNNSDEKTSAAPYVYVPDLRLPAAYMFDIDGTLAHMHDRGPFEWHKVGNDKLNSDVVRVLQRLAYGGRVNIILMSGRDEVCRPETNYWLSDHGIVRDDLFMRPEGNMRKDSVVKLEMFREHVAPEYNVLGVFDDRQQVVDMWRSIGLTCFQVAPGNF